MKEKKWKKGVVIGILLVLIFCLRYYFSLPVYKDGDRVRLSTTVYTDPVIYEDSQYLKLENLKIYLPKYPEINYGDSVVIDGLVEGNKLKNPKLISVDTSKSDLSIFRLKLINFYKNNLPEPYAGLISGVILGSKAGLTSDFWEMVKQVGLSHVVVASGTNVTFVGNYLMVVCLYFFPRRKSIYFVILGIVLYLFISGFDAPLVRAALMVFSLYLAQLTGRVVKASSVLLGTAALMLLIKPAWITDLGFILSFVSTASLMLFEAKVRKRISFLPEFLKEGFSTSLAAQIGVTPILFVTFGQFNILSPIINMLVLWTIPFIMILGSLGALVGLVVPFLGKSMLYLSYPFLWWFVEMVRLFNF